MKKEQTEIKTLVNNNRMSTQELLQLISSKIEDGYCEFKIEACGQHNIGGSSWAKEKGKELKFYITNPGQRVGAMALSGTEIYVEGSAPADVGWLNSGAKITVNGDCGDTAGHCAASGKIYVSGRVGTRSGALMKRDPKFEPPELWVLKNTGSFSFEFMGGGIAVICGIDCEDSESVLGYRSCVGMVGGTIFVRGNIADIADCVQVINPDEKDIEFLKSGLSDFLKSINRIDLYERLTDFSLWHKIIPLPENLKEDKISVKEFRSNSWINGGIFGDFINDDFEVFPMPATGDGRVHIPVYDKTDCIKCKICENNCPQTALSVSDEGCVLNFDLCIGCGICEAVCPKNCWKIISNRKEIS